MTKDQQIKPYEPKNILKSITLDTPLGPMIAIGDDTYLYVLEFMDRRILKKEIKRLELATNAVIIPGKASSLDAIESELTSYFNGKLSEFKTPFLMLGSPFQKRVWEALQKIPYGKTCSYGDLAQAIEKPTAYRAAANANGANQLAIIIPCHRVINSDGKLGGYGGGVQRKQMLLDLEKRNSYSPSIRTT